MSLFGLAITSLVLISTIGSDFLAMIVEIEVERGVLSPEKAWEAIEAGEIVFLVTDQNKQWGKIDGELVFNGYPSIFKSKEQWLVGLAGCEFKVKED